jgi:hypothetical protein
MPLIASFAHCHGAALVHKDPEYEPLEDRTSVQIEAMTPWDESFTSQQFRMRVQAPHLLRR